MKQTWFTCSRCGHQFKAAANHNHHCPRCNHYPSLVGKVRLQTQQPRVTRQFSPSTSSGTFPQMPGYNQPTQPGQFTQAGWPSQAMPPMPPPGPQDSLKGLRSSWAWYRRTNRPLQLVIGCGMVLLLLCVCFAGLGVIASANQVANATPTSGPVAQAGRTPTNQATSQNGTTPTVQPSPTPTPTPTPTPSPTPTPKPKPTPTPKPSCPYPPVNNNPWCYTFTNTGKYIYNPPGDFCAYFPCIPSFGDSSGYIVQCVDGEYSNAGGISGACSRHGGVKRPLYAP